MPKKLILFLLVLMLMLIFTPVTSAYGLTNDITDMPKEKYWSYNALNDAIENGLIKGYDNKINPTSNIARAQIAAILNRAFGATDTADLSKYTDMSSKKWYYTDMAKAINMETFNGTADNMLLPQNNATRQEVFCVLARALNLNSQDTAVLDNYSDKNDIAGWAKESTAALIENNYIKGSYGKLNPKDKITLQEFAQIMDNVIKQYINKEGTYTLTPEGNVMINCPNVVLKDTTIKGDLILGEGVGNGDITIDNTKVTGRLLARGGGQNTIKIKSNSNIANLIINKTGSGAIHIKTEGGVKIDFVNIDDGKDDVILEGSFGSVTVKTDTQIIVNNATIGTLGIEASNANVSIEGTSTITETQIEKNATAANLNVSKDSTIDKVVTEAEGVRLEGDGKIKEVNKNQSHGTSSGSGTNPGTAPGTTQDYTDVTSSSEFKNALTNPDVKGIKVAKSLIFAEQNGESFLFAVEKPILVDKDVTLTIKSPLDIYSDVTNNGTIVVYADNSWRTTVALVGNEKGHANIVNNGRITISGDLEIYSGSKFDNKGTVNNEGKINYHYVLGGSDSGECPEIQNLTGSGNVSNMAVILTQEGLKDAFERQSGTDLFFTDLYLEKNSAAPSADGEFVMPSTEYSVRADHEFQIGENVTFTIPVGSTFTIENDGAMMISGELIVKGSCINNGYYEKSENGTIVGKIDTVEDGDYALACLVNDEGSFIQAAEDEHCYDIIVDSDITLNSDVNVSANLIVNEGKTLTIGSNKTLSLNIRRDGKEYDAFNNVKGTIINSGILKVNYNLNVDFNGKLTNEGTIILDNNSSIFVANEGYESTHHGLLDNSKGIVDIHTGGLDYRDYQGNFTPWFIANPDDAVRTYFNLADVARELYNRQHDYEDGSDLLDQATNSDIEGYRSTYNDWSELKNEFNCDEDGIKGISMLLKNGILTPADENHLYPYEPVKKIQVIELMYGYAMKIIEKYNLEGIDDGPDVEFSDLEGLTDPQTTAVNYLAKAGVIEPDNEGKLNPDSYVLNVWNEKINHKLVTYDDTYGMFEELMNRLSNHDSVVTNIEQLKVALQNSVTGCIVINGDITLDGNMTITKDVKISSGASLNTQENMNLTIDYGTARDEQGNEYMSSYGRLFVEGTLNIVDNSTLFNFAEIQMNEGSLYVNGKYEDTEADQFDGKEQIGFLEANSSTIVNEGTFDNNGTIRLNKCTFTNKNTYTNNGNLEVIGGSISSSSRDGFNNAGRLRIEDIYCDYASDDVICEHDIQTTMTDGSNKAEYIAVVTTEKGLRNALAAHKEIFDKANSESRHNEKGLDYYDGIEIQDDIIIGNELTVENVDLFIKALDIFDGNEGGQTKYCILTNNSTINLKNATLNVYGKVLNNGTINCGEQSSGGNDIKGNITVWPLGEFVNGEGGTVNETNGEFLEKEN